MDGVAACPFVAFDDDRESRSTSPDHRHRCYAEPRPAPRAAAHQEAYCLSGAFPVCPTFQDWARREAAHAAGEGERPGPAPSAAASGGASAPSSSAEPGTDHDDDDAAEEPAPVRSPLEEPPITRNPPRDWAAPPPWAPGGVGGSIGAGARRSAEGAGLAGSAADRLAAGAPGPGPSATPTSAPRVNAAAPPDEELADLVSPAQVRDRSAHGYQPPKRPGNRPSVSSTRSAPRDVVTGPAWERARRYEAYPTIRTRVGLPQLPRIGVLAVALAIAALGLFFLPALLGVGGGGGGGGGGGSGGGSGGTASPSTSESVATSSPPPTSAPGPTPQTYVIAAGDTLSKVAKRFGLTLEELLAANKDTIVNPDKIAIGDEIVIPSKLPDVINDASPGPTAS